MPRVLIREGQDIWTHTQRGGGPVKAEAEIGITQPQSQKLEGETKTWAPQPPEGARPCWHLDFGLPVCRNVRESVCFVLSHLDHGNLLQWPESPYVLGDPRQVLSFSAPSMRLLGVPAHWLLTPASQGPFQDLRSMVRWGEPSGTARSGPRRACTSLCRHPGGLGSGGVYALVPWTRRHSLWGLSFLFCKVRALLAPGGAVSIHTAPPTDTEGPQSVVNVFSPSTGFS